MEGGHGVAGVSGVSVFESSFRFDRFSASLKAEAGVSGVRVFESGFRYQRELWYQRTSRVDSYDR